MAKLLDGPVTFKPLISNEEQRKSIVATLLALLQKGRYKEVMAIVEGIAAAKAALDVSKTALDLLRFPKIDGEQVRTRLIEMQDLIFSAQSALSDAEEENRNLKRQLDFLKSAQEIAASLVFAEDAYWRRKPDGKLEGPFCPTCWDDTGKTVRLKRYGEGEFVGQKGRAVSYDCVLHKTQYFFPPGIFNPNSDLIS